MFTPDFVQMPDTEFLANFQDRYFALSTSKIDF